MITLVGSLKLLAKDYAVNLAMGNVDPKMKTSIANNFPFPAQESLWQPRDLCLSVETIDNVKINWTVPSLPVLTVEFAKLQVNNTSTMKPALTKAEDTGRVKAGNVIICTKWCDLVIESVPYLVFWEFRQSAPLELSNGLIIDVADDNNSSDEDSNDNSEYTLPFKVLGVAHSPPVQLSLLLTKLQAEADDYPRKK